MDRGIEDVRDDKDFYEIVPDLLADIFRGSFGRQVTADYFRRVFDRLALSVEGIGLVKFAPVGHNPKRSTVATYRDLTVNLSIIGRYWLLIKLVDNTINDSPDPGTMAVKIINELAENVTYAQN